MWYATVHTIVSVVLVLCNLPFNDRLLLKYVAIFRNHLCLGVYEYQEGVVLQWYIMTSGIEGLIEYRISKRTVSLGGIKMFWHLWFLITVRFGFVMVRESR